MPKAFNTLKSYPLGFNMLLIIEQNSIKHTKRQEYISMFHLSPEAMFIITTMQTNAK